MKKARIALCAIGLFAVVGGAFAFKATRQINIFYTSRTFTTTTVPGGPITTLTYCDVTYRTRYTTDVIPGVPTLVTSASTTTTTVPCPLTTLYSTL